MPRIRTIKPDFFKHEALFEAELETGLPLRVAYAGLWTQADREGRFLWRPRPLKLDILPYDNCDFGQVLDALATRGFLVKYSDGKRDIGAIPSFLCHQVINNRESASKLPAPPDNIEEFDASPTRDPRVTHAACGEGKGREGKGITEASASVLSEPSVSNLSKPRRPKAKNAYTADYEGFWIAYPQTQGMSKMDGFKAWKKLSDEEQAQAMASLPAFKALLAKTPERSVKHVQGFLNGRMFESFGGTVTHLDSVDQWEKRLAYARANGEWSGSKWGPAPGKPGCRVPNELIRPGDGQGWQVAKAA